MAEIHLDRPGSFSLAAAVRFAADFGPLGYSAEDGVLRLAFPLDGYESTAGAAVREVGGSLIATVTDAAVVPQLSRILSLDDGRAFETVLARDPVLARVTSGLAGLRPVLFASPYEAAAWSILSTRRPYRQAEALKRRLAEERGEPLDLEGTTVHAFPLPARILDLDPLPGLTGDRLERLRGVARAALEGRLDAARLRTTAPEQALAEIREIRGLGPFFASLVLVRGAGAPDYLPLEVPRVRQAIARAYGLAQPSEQELAAIAEGWRPYRSWVSFLLRAAAEPPALSSA